MKCKIKNCENPVLHSGYCAKHYAQWHRHGRILPKGLRDEQTFKLKINHAELILTGRRGEYINTVLLDKDDIERVKKYKWHWGKTAVQAIIDGKVQSLGRFILKIRGLDQIAIHKNADFLDCRKANLSAGTVQQRVINSKLPVTNKSGHKGVCQIKATGKWVAYLIFRGKKYSGGSFTDKGKAVAARKRLEEIFYKDIQIKA